MCLLSAGGHCYHIQFIIVETETKGDYKKYMVLGKHEAEDSKVCLLRPDGGMSQPGEEVQDECSGLRGGRGGDGGRQRKRGIVGPKSLGESKRHLQQEQGV